MQTKKLIDQFFRKVYGEGTAFAYTTPTCSSTDHHIIGSLLRGLGLRSSPLDIWGFPKIRGTILGVPIIRTKLFLGLYWGPLILGNYHLEVEGLRRKFPVSGLRDSGRLRSKHAA